MCSLLYLNTTTKLKDCQKIQPEDYWSSIAHMSAEDMLKSALRKTSLKILNLSDSDQVNDLDLWYSKSFMYSTSWLHLPNFNIIDYNSSEKSIVLIFFSYKSIGDQIWPCRKIWSWSNQGHHLNKLGSTHVLDAAYQVSSNRPFGSSKEDL